MILSGCASNPTSKLFLSTKNQLQQRSQETRTYETHNEEHVLRATIGLLQDMGYTFETCNEHFGLLTASALREADNATAKAIGAFFFMLLVSGGNSTAAPATDKIQHIFATVVTSKMPNNNVQVRVTFTRTIYRTDNSSYIERIENPQIYQMFFRHLDQALFLEGIPFEAPAV